MRNATQKEVEYFNKYEVFTRDIVYNVDFLDGVQHYRKKVHIKQTPSGMLVLEDMQGTVHVVVNVIAFMSSKAPSQQPKKPRRKPVRGQKPEKLIPMSADVKLKVGDCVVLESGKRSVVDVVDLAVTRYPYHAVGAGWYARNGDSTLKGRKIDCGWSITHKVVPYQEWATQGKSATPLSAAEDAFNKGYWVPHFATENSDCPEWAKGFDVNYIHTHEVYPDGDFSYPAKNLDWGCSPGVVAYRKAKAQQ